MAYNVGTKELITSLLDRESLPYIDRGEYATMSSPFRVDKKPSLVIYYNSCRVHDFGDDYSVGFFQFLNDIIHYKKSTVEHTHTRRTAKKRESFKHIDSHAYADEARLYLASRNINPDFYDAYQFSTADYYGRRLIIPIEDTYEARAMNGAQPKCLYPPNSEVSRKILLSGCNKNELLISEGSMDMYRLLSCLGQEQYTYLSLLGSSISRKQAQFINSFDTINIYIDDDYAGKLLLSKLDSAIEGEFYVLKTTGKDPGDSTDEEINEAIQNKKTFSEVFIETIIKK